MTKCMVSVATCMVFVAHITCMVLVAQMYVFKQHMAKRMVFVALV